MRRPRGAALHRCGSLAGDEFVGQAGGFGEAEGVATGEGDLHGGVEGEAVADADVDGFHVVAGPDGHADVFAVVQER